MRFSIISEIPGRTRLQLAGPVPESDLDALLKLSGDIDGVHKVRVYGRIGQMALEYDEPRRASVLDALGALDAQAIADAKTGYVMQLEPRKHKLVMDLATLIGAHYARRWFLPTPLRAVFVVAGYMAFLRAALHELAQPRLTVPVLDASAIGISFVKRDVDTAGQTMFLLNVGELLEDYTRAMSENELINSLLDVPDKAQKVVGDTEVSVAATELEPGDLVAVRTGMSICIDGVVEQGSAMVNQATLTGEPLAVERSAGDDVFAGTVVEDGSILVRVRANTAQTKLRSIVSLVQTADSLKSEGQSHMEDLANKIVPWNFLLAGLVALTTRSLIKTSAALMVDYSCALRLATPLAILTAMKQGTHTGVLVKGGRYLEALAEVDTVVLDKTGTLTQASPKLSDVVSLDPTRTEDEVLALAACLEEHFPHPASRAVVRAAQERGLDHFTEEHDSTVKYVVAHGICSSVDGEKVIIGSRHFIEEDEKVDVSAATEHVERLAEQGKSILYMALGGKLIGILGIVDPLRPESRKVIAALRRRGIRRIVMLTGDDARTAKTVAQALGIQEFRAQVLPTDKAGHVQALKKEGCKVLMIGDGVNDSPALSCADVGATLKEGSDIAQEVADVVLMNNSLADLPYAIDLGRATMSRIKENFTVSVGLNTGFLAGGLTGALTPATGAVLHNMTTIGVCLNAMRPPMSGSANDRHWIAEAASFLASCSETTDGKKAAEKLLEAADMKETV